MNCTKEQILYGRKNLFFESLKMRNNYLQLLLLTMLINTELYSQNKSMELSNYQLRIAKATDSIKLDGMLKAAAWETAETATDFWMQFPNVDSMALAGTEIRMT
tara:strand:+ start:3621 stop:3932 length:312 start_codon:yes stop_codon:yes gene_type:complete